VWIADQQHTDRFGCALACSYRCRRYHPTGMGVGSISDMVDHLLLDTQSAVHIWNIRLFPVSAGDPCDSLPAVPTRAGGRVQDHAFHIDSGHHWLVYVSVFAFLLLVAEAARRNDARPIRFSYITEIIRTVYI
jgi:hypothetical protein